MFDGPRELFRTTLREIEEAGLEKSERVIGSRQGASISVASGQVLNFCANNYLGLSSDPQILEAAHHGLDERGFGLSSVRFICGTQDIHKELEGNISRFLGTDDTILYSSCFDANGGLFETVLSQDDAIVSDALNHASIIDGVRLCKAKRFRYQNRDMKDLEAKLEEASSARHRMIATDGVFSMDGTYAPLAEICDLAERYNAMVLVDDSHATGFVGETGRGTPELFGALLHGSEQIADLPVPVAESPGAVRIGHPERGHLVEYLAPNSVFNSLPRQRSSPHLRPDDRLVTIDRVFHHASLGAA